MMTLHLWDTLTPERVEEWLTDTPDAIGMTRITAPSVMGGGTGLIGFVVIAESHLSLHQAGMVVWADVFSCQDFKEQKTLRMTADILRGKLIAHTSISRVSEPHLGNATRTDREVI
jgi:S-adenosylmethionine/arginine decarboxylase-like enzyme